MASLRKIASENLDAVKDGIAWIAIWKKGRSWFGKTFFPDYSPQNDGISFCAEDLKELELIKDADANACLLNAEYHNLGGMDTMTAQTLALMLEWQYVDVAKYKVCDFIGGNENKAQKETKND